MEIQEQNTDNQWSTVPFDKIAFKIRKDLQKKLKIRIKSSKIDLAHNKLKIERCFGLLMCAGRSLREADMHLLEFSFKMDYTDATGGFWKCH